MSVEQMSLVWKHEFGHSEQSIMMALADHAHDDGTEIRPSVARIAWKTGYEERQVHRILKTLRDDLRVLVLVKEGGGRGKPNVYRFDWTKGVKKSEFRTTKRVTSETVKGDISELNPDIAVSPEPSSIEPSENHTSNDVEGEPSPGQFVAYLREELGDADVPLLRNREDRYAGEFNRHIKKGIVADTLYKVCDRIVERWLDLDDTGHRKLRVEQALEDVVNGAAPKHVGKDSQGAGRSTASGASTPQEIIEYVFANTRNPVIKSGEERIRSAMATFDFTGGDSPPYPVQKKLGGDDSEAWAVLESIRTLCRRALQKGAA